MRLIASAAVAFAAANSHAITSAPKASEYFEVNLAEAHSKSEIAPLVAYGMAKRAADGICLIWDNRVFIQNTARWVYRDLKKVGGRVVDILNSRDLRTAWRKAKVFFRDGARALGNAARSAAATAGRLFRTGARVVSNAYHTARRWASSLKFWLAQERAKHMLAQAQADQDDFERERLSLAEVDADVKAEDKVAAKLLGLNMTTLKRKAGEAAQLLMKLAAYTPWGGQLASARTIVDFINKLRYNRPIAASDVMDVACAINSFLPSMSGLGSFFSASPKGKLDIIKDVAKSGFTLEAAQGVAQENAQKCMQKFVSSRGTAACDMINQAQKWGQLAAH